MEENNPKSPQNYPKKRKTSHEMGRPGISISDNTHSHTSINQHNTHFYAMKQASSTPWGLPSEPYHPRYQNLARR